MTLPFGNGPPEHVLRTKAPRVQAGFAAIAVPRERPARSPTPSWPGPDLAGAALPA